jgi:hypothetical protein
VGRRILQILYLRLPLPRLQIGISCVGKPESTGWSCLWRRSAPVCGIRGCDIPCQRPCRSPWWEHQSVLPVLGYIVCEFNKLCFTGSVLPEAVSERIKYLVVFGMIHTVTASKISKTTWLIYCDG